jgi:hypothetical protein
MPVQFPKVLVQPLQRLLVALHERGVLGRSPMKRHVVVCGFPRSGSTLLQLMIEACVSDIQTFGRERHALEMAQTVLCRRSFMMTKTPSDIFRTGRLIEHYRERAADVRFLLTLRDPRGVLTSVHKKRPGEYYVSAERWRAIHEYWKWARHLDPVLTIRYEDLVTRPAFVEQQLTHFVGWKVERPFASYQQAVPKRFDATALNGIRDLDPRNIDRWRSEQHLDRLRRLVEVELPELPNALIEMGYERDCRWLEYLAIKSPRDLYAA